MVSVPCARSPIGWQGGRGIGTKKAVEEEPLNKPSFSAQMAESGNGLMVTEEMLTAAARAGDLESLTAWARQGVRITSGEPLL